MKIYLIKFFVCNAHSFPLYSPVFKLDRAAMDPIFNTVNRTAGEIVSPSGRMPTGLEVAFFAVHKVHRAWRWYRWGKVYSNPDNFFMLTTGHIVNYMAGDHIVVRMAAQCILIASRITDCVNQQEALSKAYHKWCGNFCGDHFAGSLTVEWPGRPPAGLLPPSVCFTWDKEKQQAAKRIRRVIRHTFKLLNEIFKLSMTMMDAVEVFSLSPATRNEAVNELFLNATKSLDKLVENKEELAEKLKENKNIVEKILSGIGAQYTADLFIESVEKSLRQVEKASRTVHKINNAANGLFKDVLKQGVFGFMCTLGIAECLPDFLAPSLDTPHKIRPEREYGRYAPLHWTTRLEELEIIPPERLRKKAKEAKAWQKVAAENSLIRYIREAQTESMVPKPRKLNKNPRRFKGQSIEQAFEEAVKLYGYQNNLFTPSTPPSLQGKAQA